MFDFVDDLSPRLVVRLVGLSFAAVIGLLLAVVWGVRRWGISMAARVAASGVYPIAAIPNSDAGYGPAYLLRGDVNVRITTVASQSDSGRGDEKNAETRAFASLALRIEKWVVAVDDLDVGGRRAFTITRRGIFAAKKAHDSIEARTTADFARRFRVEIWSEEAEALLTPAVLKAVESLFAAGVSSIQLDRVRTLRVTLPKPLWSSLPPVIAQASRVAAVASALVSARSHFERGGTR